MNQASPLLLLGIGTAGCAIARGINRAFGSGVRMQLADTDASAALEGEPFTLLGGDRLSGHGSGGDVVAARLAAEDSVQALDASLEGVRLVVIVTALGGGTGGGATFETVKRLQLRGIPSVVFATTPFTFEGEDRQRNARGMMGMIEEASNSTFFIPLDKLVDGTDNFEEALRRAIDTLAGAVTLFWRLLEKPGYIRLEVERIRHLVTGAGRGRFAIASAQGDGRAAEAIERLVRSPLLTDGSGPVRSIVCGILGGEDLRLSELARISDGLRSAFATTGCSFELATVNDESTFSGRLSVVVLLFEANGRDAREQPAPTTGTRRPPRHVLGNAPTGRGRFNNSAPTIWHGEDLDTPTYLRQNITLEF